jgi:hypothetical protein
MDQATGEFLRRLAALVGTHDAARWVGAAEIFPNAPAQARALPA